MLIPVNQLKVGQIVFLNDHGRVAVVYATSPHFKVVCVDKLGSGNHNMILFQSSPVSLLDADFYDAEGNCVYRTYANQEEISHEPLVAEKSIELDNGDKLIHQTYDQPIVSKCIRCHQRPQGLYTKLCGECYDKCKPNPGKI